MKPGDLVRWKFPTQPGVKFVGRIVSVNGGEPAQVQANGVSYIVEKVWLRPVPTCARCGGQILSHDKGARYCSRKCYLSDRQKPACVHCGRPVGHTQSKYCSRQCMKAAMEGETDREVFAALISYKGAHDGLSPSLPLLAKEIYMHEQTIGLALNRLVAAGKIRYEGEMSYRSIVVVGGKWTFEPILHGEKNGVE